MAPVAVLGIIMVVPAVVVVKLPVEVLVKYVHTGNGFP
jgi:hypothetical protein